MRKSCKVNHFEEQRLQACHHRSLCFVLELARELQVDSGRLVYCTADISRYDQVEDAVRKAVKEIGDIDILVNNAGLALGAPNRFPDLKVEDIVQMTRTNIDGYMFAAYAALNVGGMKNRKRGIILNVTSVTGLEGRELYKMDGR